MKFILFLLLPVLAWAQIPADTPVTILRTENKCIFRIDKCIGDVIQQTYTLGDSGFLDLVAAYSATYSQLQSVVPMKKSARYTLKKFDKDKKLKCKIKDGAELEYDIKIKTEEALLSLIVALASQGYYLWQDE
jgi:hypothetical protein